MASDNKNHGIESEQLTQAIASVRFLSDFTFPNPTYKKGGVSRELADLFVILDDTLIVFQVKSHLARAHSEHDFERASRKIYKAFRQFRSLLEAIKDAELLFVRSSRGFEVPFNLKSFKNVFLVVVIHYLQDNDRALPLHFRTLGFCDENTPISFRAFEFRDFLFITEQFDTIPDFTLFLRLMDFLELKTDVAPTLDFPDLIAFLKMHYEEVIDLLDSGRRPPHLYPGIAKEFLRRIDEFMFHESYLIDDVLDALHTGTRNINDVYKTLRGLRFPPNSFEAYWHTATSIARTSRMQRQHIARLLCKKREVAVGRGYAFAAIMLEDGSEAVLIHSSFSSRVDRVKELGGLALSFLATHPVDSVLGVAAPPGFGADDHDFITIRREWAGDLESVRHQVQEHNLFAAPRHLQPSE